MESRCSAKVHSSSSADDTPQTSYKCEECDEYLLIEEATSASSDQQSSPASGEVDNGGLKQRDKGKILKVDSGYEAKVFQSSTCTSSPQVPQEEV